jgi:cytochrome c oxidase subunit 2
MPSPRRHLLIAGAAWFVLSAAGMALVAGIQILPQIASREAGIEDEAFVLLTVAAVPVLLLVVVGGIYSVLRFRVPADDLSDGPPIHGHAGVQTAWVGVSTILVLGLFGYGAVGLVDIRGDTDSTYRIEVEAEQWTWHFRYPGSEVDSKELHIPVGQRVELAITSLDVIHSFWVPAFGIKQDAVPGRTTVIHVTVNDAGTYRGQCAELCGGGHTFMLFDTVAQSEAELADWLAHEAEHGPEGGPPPSGGEPPPP